MRTIYVVLFLVVFFGLALASVWKPECVLALAGFILGTGFGSNAEKAK